MRVLAVFLLGTCLSAAETKEERAKQVVNDAVEAMGGAKFLSMRDRVEAGRAYSFYRDELSGLAVAKIYTRYLDRPAEAGPEWLGVEERQTFGKNENSAVLFSGGKGFEITFRGARPIAEDRLERFRISMLSDIFYILRQRMKEPGLILESEGSEVWENQPVEIVKITDAENRVVNIYFHRSTKLPVRQVFYRRDPKTKDRIEETVEYGKYRDAGGVQWPFYMLRIRDGQKVYQIFSETVNIDSGLSASLFTLPASMKILKAQR